MIASDLQVSGNGVLTINPDGPPAGAAALGGAAVGGATDVRGAAIDALLSGGGLSGPGTPADQQAMNDIVMSLGGSADLFNGSSGAAKKKTS
jgi:hypothetical protein